MNNTKLLTNSNVMKMLGIESSNTSFYEKIISSFGGVLAIYITYVITHIVLADNQTHSDMLIASLGASSVLVFVTPHSALSQPWNVFAGHTFSALMGYVALMLFSDVTLASALAVGGAISIMYLTRSIHPPGGATALFVVLAGSSTQNFAMMAVIETLVSNLVALLIIGFVFNNLFYWRRYPSYLHCRHANSPKNVNNLSHEDFSAALLYLDSYVDVSAQELALIFDLAIENSNHTRGKNKIALAVHCFYSNAELGKQWRVRQVLAINKKEVSYRTVVGTDTLEPETCSLKTFQKWAKWEVTSENKTWVKKHMIFANGERKTAM